MSSKKIARYSGAGICKPDYTCTDIAIASYKQILS